MATPWELPTKGGGDGLTPAPTKLVTDAVGVTEGEAPDGRGEAVREADNEAECVTPLALALGVAVPLCVGDDDAVGAADCGTEEALRVPVALAALAGLTVALTELRAAAVAVALAPAAGDCVAFVLTAAGGSTFTNADTASALDRVTFEKLAGNG